MSEIRSSAPAESRQQQEDEESFGTDHEASLMDAVVVLEAISDLNFQARKILMLLSGDTEHQRQELLIPGSTLNRRLSHLIGILNFHKSALGNSEFIHARAVAQVLGTEQVSPIIALTNSALLLVFLNRCQPGTMMARLEFLRLETDFPEQFGIAVSDEEIMGLVIEFRIHTALAIISTLQQGSGETNASEVITELFFEAGAGVLPRPWPNTTFKHWKLWMRRKTKALLDAFQDENMPHEAVFEKLYLQYPWPDFVRRMARFIQTRMQSPLQGQLVAKALQAVQALRHEGYLPPAHDGEMPVIKSEGQRHTSTDCEEIPLSSPELTYHPSAMGLASITPEKEAAVSPDFPNPRSPENPSDVRSGDQIEAFHSKKAFHYIKNSLEEEKAQKKAAAAKLTAARRRYNPDDDSEQPAVAVGEDTFVNHVRPHVSASPAPTSNPQQPDRENNLGSEPPSEPMSEVRDTADNNTTNNKNIAESSKEAAGRAESSTSVAAKKGFLDRQDNAEKVQFTQVTEDETMPAKKRKLRSNAQPVPVLQQQRPNIIEQQQDFVAPPPAQQQHVDKGKKRMRSVPEDEYVEDVRELDPMRTKHSRANISATDSRMSGFSAGSTLVNRDSGANILPGRTSVPRNEPRALSVEHQQRSLRSHRQPQNSRSSPSNGRNTPQPSYMANLGKLETMRAAIPRERTKRRQGWAIEEEDRLIELIGQHGLAWKHIENLDDPLLQGRTNVMLKDKAISLKVIMYRNSLPAFPVNFERLRIRTKDVIELRDKYGIEVNED